MEIKIYGLFDPRDPEIIRYVGKTKMPLRKRLQYILTPMNLDEILENIDSEGIQLFMKLLKEKMPEKNIFVVTQRFEQFRDLFESELYFKVENGFTRKV